MKTWRTRKAAPAAAALAVAAGVLLAGYSSGDGTTTQAPSAPSPTTSTAKVTDKALDEALNKLAFQGTGSSREDGGACLASAARKAGMPEESLDYVVKVDSDDMGAVIDGLNKVSEDDAALLASRSLREDFDACIDKAVLPNGSSLKTQSYVPPKGAAKPVAGQPNLEPAYPVRANQPVNSSIELSKGLVSMFSSYARDEGQRKTYAAAGQCLSTLVYNAGFSQEVLHFFAGGAPLGTGSIVEHLPNDKDKAIWQSPRFTQGLVDCTTNATPTPMPGP
ncbi:hypothetical protein PV735_44775 [Streptomyces turgidiscabies]|uniref:Lipoprotein n=1 Tax=Streptomyces turgidiscabies (strain Car8) TaxID=698760 RepID=L7F2H6_STRT8|nr:hypothetical protein [Streptomyces turgidiscabies]ELP65833.1 hypothetical protein STRTUCAR8_01813 [Streptomyces turgidiscabies Car8]MDX3499738.1 hypothetical protein [Streptomyces turgidiscabies]GAQ76004.1 hypothetical protein T45_07792 [Streptomyces turgidiscabies]